MHLVRFWPSPTSMARREHQRRASGTRWWVGTVRFCVQKKGLISMQNDPVSRLIRHHPVSAQAYQCTSFASGLRPHPWRGGNTNGGHLERGGVSERSVSVCVQKGRGELFPYKMTLVSPHSTSPRLRTGESMHLVRFWPSPTSMARREHQLWPSGVRWWVGTVRFFCVQKGRKG